jgi:hypothetical protein
MRSSWSSIRKLKPPRHHKQHSYKDRTSKARDTSHIDHKPREQFVPTRSDMATMRSLGMTCEEYRVAMNRDYITRA